MSGKTMDERVTTLEKLADTLAPLPGEVAGLTVRMAAVESQQLQLRAEMHAEFLAVRQEMASMEAELREDIAAQGREMAASVLDVRSELREVRSELREVRSELREVRAELGDQMRLLHEDLVERIARIGRG